MTDAEVVEAPGRDPGASGCESPPSPQASVAQRQERRSPKPQDEGSNPSRRARLSQALDMLPTMASGEISETQSKRCFRCGEVKPLTDFNRHRGSRDGLQKRGRACDREPGREAYQRNPGRFRRNRQLAIDRARRFLWQYLTEHPCVECGERDPVVLEFDHVRGDKRADVGYLVGTGGSLRSLIEEVEKCDVRCANCHRRKTASQLGWWHPGSEAQAVERGSENPEGAGSTPA